MWGFAIQLTVWAGLYLYSKLTRPSIPKPKPATRDNLQLPRTEEGSAIPMPFGRVRIQSPVLVWMSDLKSKTTDAGDRGFVISYGLNQLYVLGVPMGAGVTMGNDLNDKAPRLWSVWYGDKKLPTPAGGRIPHAGSQLRRGQAVLRTDFLGGPGAGGGLVGIYRFHGGYTDQSLFFPPTPIGDAMIAEGVDTSLVPGYRRQMLCSFTNYIPLDNNPSWYNEINPDPGVVDNSVARPAAWTIGESPNIDGFSFEVSTYGDKVFSMVTPGYDFNGGADPMEVIYDVVTNPWSKVGLDASKIDMTSFLAASTVLKAEGHGYSMVHYDTEDAESIISAVLRQIDCAMYEEPTTGKLVAKLIRNDYVPSSLLILNRSNIISVTDYTMSAWVNSINEVRVSYTEPRLDYKPAMAIAMSIANAVGNSNRRNSKTVDYPGINHPDIAAKVAIRDLSVLSRPLAKISFVANRDAKDLRPGSVFKVTYDEYNLEEKIFRAQRVDLGQLHKGEVTIDAVEDVFASTYAGIAFTYTSLERTTPYPLVEQFVIEAPRWFARKARLSGIAGSEDSPRLLALAPQSKNTERLFTTTRVRPQTTSTTQGPKPKKYQALIDRLTGQYTKDLPPVAFPVTGTVTIANLTRAEEPFINTGIRVTNVVGADEVDLVQMGGTDYSIRNHGAPMLLVVNKDGSYEFMCFEQCILQSPGVYRFDKLWRGMMDTPPIDILIGARVWLISPFFVGRKGYDVDDVVQYALMPASDGYTGSGGDPYNEFTMKGRTFLPLPPSDYGVTVAPGVHITGATGTPNIGRYKQIDSFDSSFNTVGNFRDRRNSTICKGSDASDVAQEASPVSTVPYAYKLPIDLTGGGSLGFGAAGVPNGIVTGFGTTVLIDGYGQHVLQAKTYRQIPQGDPIIGLGGFSYLETIESLLRPTLKIYAYEWRDIAGNGLLNASTDWFFWTNWTRNTGTSSVSRAASGAYWQPTGSSNTLDQTVSVKNWNPRGLTAIAWGYVRNLNSDTSDSISIDVAALDAFASVLASSSSGSFGPLATSWAYRESTALTLPAITQLVRWRAIATEVAGGGTANPDTCVGRVGITIGQFYNNTLSLLSNPSFESGGTASWTVTTGSFTTNTAIASPSATYVRGGTANATMYQEYALPVGYEYGTYALCRFYAAGLNASNLMNFRIQAMDASSNVLAEYFREEFSATLNEWTPFLGYLDLPIGSTKVRVQIEYLYQGTGASELAVDEFHLSLHKHLDPVFEQKFDFTATRTQLVPATWQDFAISFPTLPQPDFVFSGSDFSSSFNNDRQDTGKLLEWSDNTAHAVAKMPGAFVTTFDGTESGRALFARTSVIDAFRFTRQSGGGAVCVEARDNSIDQLAAYGEANSFSVMVMFRVDELTWSGTACGLTGRRDLTRGWCIQIAAGGTLQAVFEGASGTKTATVSGAVNDGAVHSAILVYDAVADTITLYRDGIAGSPVSTASGLGEFARKASTCRLRIGRSTSSDDTLPGVIGRVYIWDSALSSGNVSTLWTYAKPPTGITMGYTRNVAGWTQVDDASSTGDSCLLGWGTDQLARGNCGVYTLTTPPTGVESCGLVLARSNTNLIPSWDFTASGTWSAEAGATLTQGVEDPTGRFFGVTAAVTTTGGLKMVGATFGATTTARLVIWAKGTAGQVVSIALMNASDVVKSTQTITLAATWERYVVSFTGWDASSATARLRFRANAGSISFSLAHVTWLGQGTEVPVIYQGPTVTMNDIVPTWTNAFTRQMNSEGELQFKGIALADSAAAASLLQVRNTSNAQNKRELFLTTTAATFRHWDGSASSNDSTGSAFNRTLQFELRGRWNRAKTTDATANAFAGIVIDGDVDSSNYGRTATFTESSTVSSILEFNTGSNSGWNGVMFSAAIRTREEKLP